MSAKINFSLATLVLIVLWIGAAMPIWFWRVPWKHARSESRAEFEKHASKQWFESESKLRAPDRRRVCARNYVLPSEPWVAPAFFQSRRHRVIYDISTEPRTEIFDFGSTGEPLGFLDDDTLVFIHGDWGDKTSPDDDVEIYRRRFPEWWWGHFYRPEVWLFIGLSGALFWRFVRWRRKSAA